MNGGSDDRMKLTAEASGTQQRWRSEDRIEMTAEASWHSAENEGGSGSSVEA